MYNQKTVKGNPVDPFNLWVKIVPVPYPVVLSPKKEIIREFSGITVRYNLEDFPSSENNKKIVEGFNLTKAIKEARALRQNLV